MSSEQPSAPNRPTDDKPSPKSSDPPIGRHLLEATAALSLAHTLALHRLRNSPDRLVRHFADLVKQRQRERFHSETCVLLHGRLRGIDLPHCSIRLREMILELERTHSLSQAETARRCHVPPSTHSRWKQWEREGRPETVRALNPPNQRICDATRAQVRLLAHHGLGSDEFISASLARQGARVSARSVGRFRAEGAPPPSPQPHPDPPVTPADVPPPEPPPSDIALRRGLAKLPPDLYNAIDAIATIIILGHKKEVDALWAQDDPHSVLDHKIAETKRKGDLAVDVERILRRRLAGVPRRRRNTSTPDQQRVIIVYQMRWRLSDVAIARRLLLKPATLVAWRKNLRVALESSETDTLANVLLLERLRQDGLGSELAAPLFQVAARLARRTLKPATESSKPKTTALVDKRFRIVAARRPRHVYMIDISLAPSLDARDRHLIAVIDVHSRKLLAWASHDAEPSAKDAVAVLRRAVSTHGKPRYLVSDQGPQFTASLLEKAVTDLGIEHRFGAIGKKGSIAIIERFWLTLKTALHLFDDPIWAREDVLGALPLFERWYCEHRPHHGIRRATPNERWKGEVPAVDLAIPAPRGDHGQHVDIRKLKVMFMDETHRRFPYLVAA